MCTPVAVRYPWRAVTSRDGALVAIVRSALWVWIRIPSKTVTIQVEVSLDILAMSSEKVAIITGASSGTFPAYLRSLALGYGADC